MPLPLRSPGVTAAPPFPGSRRGPCSMSLQAWEWEDEDQAGMGPVSSSMGSFHQPGGECEADEYLRDRAWARASDSEHRGSSESSERPARAFSADAPHVVPCKFVIALAFPLASGKCQGRIPAHSARGGAAPLTFSHEFEAPLSGVADAGNRGPERNRQLRARCGPGRERCHRLHRLSPLKVPGGSVQSDSSLA